MATALSRLSRAPQPRRFDDWKWTLANGRNHPKLRANETLVPTGRLKMSIARTAENSLAASGQAVPAIDFISTNDHEWLLSANVFCGGLDNTFRDGTAGPPWIY